MMDLERLVSRLSKSVKIPCGSHTSLIAKALKDNHAINHERFPKLYEIITGRQKVRPITFYRNCSFLRMDLKEMWGFGRDFTEYAGAVQQILFLTLLAEQSSQLADEHGKEIRNELPIFDYDFHHVTRDAANFMENLVPNIKDSEYRLKLALCEGFAKHSERLERREPYFRSIEYSLKRARYGFIQLMTRLQKHNLIDEYKQVNAIPSVILGEVCEDLSITLEYLERFTSKINDEYDETRVKGFFDVCSKIYKSGLEDHVNPELKERYIRVYRNMLDIQKRNKK